MPDARLSDLGAQIPLFLTQISCIASSVFVVYIEIHQ